MELTELEWVGEIGVDAGLCWVGDPCYVVTPDCREHPAESWSEFCDKMSAKEANGTAQWQYRMGHDGLGVSVSTGYGDGTYSVYVVRREGRIAGVFVDFMRVLQEGEEG